MLFDCLLFGRNCLEWKRRKRGGSSKDLSLNKELGNVRPKINLLKNGRSGF